MQALSKLINLQALSKVIELHATSREPLGVGNMELLEPGEDRQKLGLAGLHFEANRYYRVESWEFKIEE